MTQPNNTLDNVLEQLIEKNESTTITTVIILFVGLCSYCLMMFLVGQRISILVLVLIALLIELAIVRFFITQHRIKRGLFGNNEAEVRELVEFVAEAEEGEETDGRDPPGS